MMKQLKYLMIVAAFISPTASGLDGKLSHSVNYSYINGVWLFWEPDGLTVPSPGCAIPDSMTIYESDPNGKNMMAMANIAIATGARLVCDPKPGCNGINNSAVVNYCTYYRD